MENIDWVDEYWEAWDNYEEQREYDPVAAEHSIQRMRRAVINGVATGQMEEPYPIPEASYSVQSVYGPEELQEIFDLDYEAGWGADNPPLDEVIPTLGLYPEVADFLLAIDDNAVKGQLVNRLKRQPGSSLVEVESWAEEIVGKQRGKKSLFTRQEEGVTYNWLSGFNVSPGDEEALKRWLLNIFKQRRLRGTLNEARGYIYRFGAGEVHDNDIELSLSPEDARVEGQRHLYTDLIDALGRLRDWLRGNPGIDVTHYTLKQAMGACEDWHQVCHLGTGDEEYSTRHIVYQFPDGWTIQEVPVADLDAEGEKMGHCVGSGGYDDDVESGRSRIFSLRDRKNQPHVTIEAARGPMDTTELFSDRGPHAEIQIKQIQGKENREPIGKHKARVKEWFSQNDVNAMADPDMLDRDELANMIKDWIMGTGKGLSSPVEEEYGMKYDVSSPEFALDIYIKLDYEARNDSAFAKRLTGEKPPSTVEGDYRSRDELRDALIHHDEQINEALPQAVDKALDLLKG